MKRLQITLIIGLVASTMMLATGCKRENGIVTLGAKIDKGRNAKVYIDDVTSCWHNNDLLRVNNQTCTTSAAMGTSADINGVVESSHYRAVYPADMVVDADISSSSLVTIRLPNTQQYEEDSRGDQKVKVPMGAYSPNESLTFRNLCSLLKVVIGNLTDDDFRLDRITVQAGNAYLSGLGTATVTGRESDAVEMVPSSASHNATLAFSSSNAPVIGRGDRDSYVYYIVLPEFDEDDVTITLYSNSRRAVFEKPRVSLRHNTLTMVNLTVKQWYEPNVDGVLPGLFSVSNTQRVHFSKGNLQYQASTNTWRFAEHQYDYVGVDNNNISSTYSGWIDLFGYGTGNNPTLNSDNYDDYSTFVDWGDNAIINGGNDIYLWRTLTQSEWDYLINGRANASAKCGSGNIGGVGGLIILPDNWTPPSGCYFRSGFIEDGYADWSRNTYSLDTWLQMEAAGAVFLPAAGTRDGLAVNGAGSAGYYWASTIGCGLTVYCSFATPDDGYSSPNGNSVRLVR